MSEMLSDLGNIYCSPDLIFPKDTEEIIYNWLKDYLSNSKNQVNILKKPLVSSDLNVEYDYGILILIPDHKIIVLNLDNTEEEKFDDYKYDIISSFDFINKRYHYEEKLGKLRRWQDHVFEMVDNINNLNKLEEYKINTEINEKDGVRFINYLISLAIGSQVPSNSISLEKSINILESIKNKIIIYDTSQKQFLHNKYDQKKLVIQGLAGTGKTELLIQKIKDIYIEEDESKIAMTCFNHVLADSLRKKIPELFDAHKVDKQIEWEKRLFVMRAWGSSFNSVVGFYSYICNKFQIPFHRYSYSISFDYACKEALKELERIEEFDFLFDYTFIDESQDFPQSFIDLALRVTRKQVIIAGDIFQNVFDNMSASSVEPNIVLKSCYRTNPKTLIFSHLLSMGMIENREVPLRWLSDQEWANTGYDITRVQKNKIEVRRNPIKRFDDEIEDNSDFIIVDDIDENNVITKIINYIKKIKKEYNNIEAHDIAIIFLENTDKNYKIFDLLEYEIKNKLNYPVNKAYLTKENKKDHIFLSNRNNIKGLEFPFVICVSTSKITTNKTLRNALYMILTRSFITSYLLLAEDNDESLINILKQKVLELESTNHILIDEPSDDIKRELDNQVISSEYLILSKKDIADDLMRNRKIPFKEQKKIHKIIEGILPEDADKEKIESAIDSAIKLLEDMKI